jgi:hypothetical protein
MRALLDIFIKMINGIIWYDYTKNHMSYKRRNMATHQDLTDFIDIPSPQHSAKRLLLAITYKF